MHVLPRQEQRLPGLPAAGTRVLIGFDQTAGCGQHQAEREVGDRLRQDLRSVCHHDAVFRRHGDVDVIEPPGEVADDLQAPRGIHDLAVDAIREEGEQTIDLRHLAEEYLAGRWDVFTIPECDVCNRPYDVQRRLRQPAGNVDPWSAHGRPPHRCVTDLRPARRELLRYGERYSGGSRSATEMARGRNTEGSSAEACCSRSLLKISSSAASSLLMLSTTKTPLWRRSAGAGWSQTRRETTRHPCCSTTWACSRSCAVSSADGAPCRARNTTTVPR